MRGKLTTHELSEIEYLEREVLRAIELSSINGRDAQEPLKRFFESHRIMRTQLKRLAVLCTLGHGTEWFRTAVQDSLALVRQMEKRPNDARAREARRIRKIMTGKELPDGETESGAGPVECVSRAAGQDPADG